MFDDAYRRLDEQCATNRVPQLPHHVIQNLSNGIVSPTASVRSQLAAAGPTLRRSTFLARVKAHRFSLFHLIAVAAGAVLFTVLLRDSYTHASSLQLSSLGSPRVDYIDTRVESPSPPEALLELEQAGKWSYGDSAPGLHTKARERRVEKRKTETDPEVPSGVVSASSNESAVTPPSEESDKPLGDGSQLDSRVLSDSRGRDDDDDHHHHHQDRSDRHSRGRHPLPVANWDHTYDNDDSHTDPEQVFFSEMSLRDREAATQMLLDDAKCAEARGVRREFDARRCLGAPFLYLTFHGGAGRRRARNVCKYSRDGCSLGSVLVPSRGYRPRNLRGLILHGPYMYVAEAWRKDSKVVKYSHCNPTLAHRREMLGVIVSQRKNLTGMIHPYGFAKNAFDEYIYVSAQGTSSVLRFHRDTGEPGEEPRAHTELDKGSSERTLPPGEGPNGSSETLTLGSVAAGFPRKLSNISRLLTYVDEGPQEQDYSFWPPGTFIKFAPENIRGLAFDAQSILYVANKEKGVLAYDREGYLLGELPLAVPRPISIYYCKDRSSLWVGSATEHTLYEFDVSTWELMQSVMHPQLKHPAGITTYGDSLYVVSQKKGKLLRFSMATGSLEEVVMDAFPDVGERIILSPC